MSNEPTRPMPRGRLILSLLGALVLAVLIVLGAILPVEFNRDPLGVGRVSGLSRLWAPEEKEAGGRAAAGPLAQFSAQPARSDVIEIPLGYVGGGVGAYSLEYKVRLKAGAVFIYDWEAIGLTDPEALEYDFHGHTLTSASKEEMTVSTHRQGKGASGHGSLVAPFDGIQGWYFSNGSNRPVVIRVRLHGFYELVQPGAEGNEAGIEANRPAEEVRARMIPPGAPAR